MEPIKDYIGRGYDHGDRTFYGARHRGIDYVAPIGTPVYAIADGSTHPRNGTQGGRMVHLHFRHNGREYVARYLHLESREKIGRVKKGDVIGRVGNTGLSTAPHLHFDISPAPFRLRPFDRFVDPLAFLKKLNHGKLSSMERKDYEQKIRELNTEIGRVTQERDSARENLVQERSVHQETAQRATENHIKWQNEIDARKKAEARLEECEDNFRACKNKQIAEMSLRERILAALGY